MLEKIGSTKQGCIRMTIRPWFEHTTAIECRHVPTY